MKIVERIGTPVCLETNAAVPSEISYIDPIYLIAGDGVTNPYWWDTGINTRHLQSKSVIAIQGVGFQGFRKKGGSAKRTCYMESGNTYFMIHAKFAEKLYTKLFQEINGRCSEFSSVPRGSINNMSSLVQIRAWCRSDDKPLSEPMMALFNDAYMRHLASMS